MIDRVCSNRALKIILFVLSTSLLRADFCPPPQTLQALVMGGDDVVLIAQGKIISFGDKELIGPFEFQLNTVKLEVVWRQDKKAKEVKVRFMSLSSKNFDGTSKYKIGQKVLMFARKVGGGDQYIVSNTCDPYSVLDGSLETIELRASQITRINSQRVVY